MERASQIIVRYDSPAIKDGFISIDVFAPSLLSLSLLCNRANEIINGSDVKSTAKVNVNIQQNCFELVFASDINLIAKIKHLFTNAHATAERILVILGLICGVTGINLLQLIKITQGKNITKIAEQGKNVIVNIGGDNNNLTVHKHVHNLYEDRIVREHTKEIIDRGLQDEQSKLIFEEIKTKKKTELTHQDFNKFIQHGWADQVKEEYKPDKVEAILTIYSPILDSEAEKWKFLYGENMITVDISATNIAADAMERGRIEVNDKYKVIMEIAQYETQAGRIKNKYKALHLIEFIPAANAGQQMFKNELINIRRHMENEPIEKAQEEKLKSSFMGSES